MRPRVVLAARGVERHAQAVDRAHRAQHLELLVPDRVGVRRDRRFHRDERQQVHHVVLDHVAQCARVVVVAAAQLDADRLRRRDLHGVDVAPVPDRLEDDVGEPQRHDVLHRLFAEVVVDAVDQLLVEDFRDFGLQRARGIEIGAERLLDDDARPAFGVVARTQARCVELVDDLREQRRRRAQVEEAVAGRSQLLVVLFELLAQLVKAARCRRTSPTRTRGAWRSRSRAGLWRDRCARTRRPISSSRRGTCRRRRPSARSPTIP